MKRYSLCFSLFPAGGVETASSRIRVYSLQAALEKIGVSSIFGYSLKSNVLFFQKKVTRENIWQARLAKIQGKAIIFDVDDLGDALWYWVEPRYFEKMITLADVITTCSEGQQRFLESRYSIDNVHVVPNSVDYFPAELARVAEVSGYRLRVAWFGNMSNFQMFAKYIPVLEQIPDLDIVAIVPAGSVADLNSRYPSVTFFPWSLCGMMTTLQSCDLTLLMHDGTEEDKAKGNNKMITSIAWGVPAIVSRTPEYLRAAQEAGIEYAVFDGVEDLPEVIERLRHPIARKEYLETAQSMIWNLYSPVAIANRYVDLANGLLKEGKAFQFWRNIHKYSRIISRLNI